MGDQRHIDRLASVQHGAFSLGQARSAGFTSRAVNDRLRASQWVQIDDSVYALMSSRDTWERRLAAALLSRPVAVLTHETATRLVGLAGFHQGKPRLLVPRGSNTRSAIARIYETDQFDRITTTAVNGFPTTTMPETILLLARDTEPTRVESVFDEALIRGLLDLSAMSQTIDREAGRRTPGTPLLRRLTSSRRPTAASKSTSYLESLLHRLLSDPKLPPWTLEEEFLLDGVPSRVDAFVPVAGLVIEADGRNWHTRQRDFEADRRRDNSLASQGIQVLRFTYEMLTREPDRCLDQILTTILVRAAEVVS